MANPQTIKGFRDFVGTDAAKRVEMIAALRRIFELYGFEPLETPIVESEEFVRGDNSSDEAVRDIFSLSDRGKRNLALRYEFTFQLKRAARNQKLPYKNYKIGYLFRDEPIRKGRLRQFIQCDIDTIGSTLKDEAECLAVAADVFSTLEIPVQIYVNNRKLINEIMESEKIPERDREQVIRELDKLDKLSKKEVADNLRKYNAERLLKIFDNEESYFEKYAMYKEISQLKKYVKKYGCEVKFKPTLARGLSYYNGSVFEIWSKKLEVSLAGGGSYLVEGVQSTGISFGLEPLFLLSTLKPKNELTLIISLDEDDVAIRLARTLRTQEVPIVILADKTIKKALEYANQKAIQTVIFVGPDEVAAKKFKVKDMNSGKEELLSESDLLKKFMK